MIEISNLRKSFGEKCACDIPQLSIGSGEIIGLVGNNGAGKTTLFRLILDLLKPDSGNVTLDGIDVQQSEDWKTFTGAYIDNGFLIDFLTPEEYFEFIAKVVSISKEELTERTAAFEQFTGGEIFGRNALIRNLSAGNKQKVGIISALITRPKLLILDEPFNFLDPSSQNHLKHIIEEYREATGATIIISSHNLTHTIDISTRILLMEQGEIKRDISEITPDAISALNEYFDQQ
ncbi:MAG: ATP-binding cassette domain-containing protein [Prevotella sp.]|nr:ATP-binding cassette domain-containing protein [Prevotella sp.]